MMECRDVREMADSFLSEQLLVETNHELLRHLETCPVCRSEMADRRALRERLRSAFVQAEGGGVFVRNSTGRSRLATLAREAAGDHQNCAVKFTLAERPIGLEDAGRRYGAPYGALATFEPAPAVDGPLELLERHACVYQGRRFGHVVFRYRGALTSLLVTDAAPPPAPELEPADSGPAVASFPAERRR